MAYTYAAIDDVAVHAMMLLDRPRVAAYARALRAVVRPGDVVVDVGSGSGVLAVIAARCGAAKVYAVERGPMAELAGRVVEANGAGGVVEVLRADAREATFELPPTVLVSETMGAFGVDEDIVGLLAAVAKRCAPGARVVPGALDICLAPARDEALAAELEALGEIEGVRLEPLRARVANHVVSRRVPAGDLVGPAQTAARLALGSARLPACLEATLVVERDAPVGAVAAWFVATLAEGVELSTGPGAPPTHWGQVEFPLDPPLPCRPGDELAVRIYPRVVLSRSLWAWEVTTKGGETRSGDAMRKVVGGARDLAGQLGLAARAVGERKPSSTLDAWAAALGAGGEGDATAMARRLLAAMPGRYADVEDARQEVRRLLAAADALG